MKQLGLLVALAIAAVPCRADSLGTGADVTPPMGWVRADPHDPSGSAAPFPTLKYVPGNGRNASVMLTLIPADLAKVSDRVSLKGLLLRASEPMLPSPGFIPDVKTLTLDDGIGAYASFEDPSLVGKPPEKGNYKVATPVEVLLANGWLVQTTVFTDSASGPDFDEALGIVSSLKARKAEASAAPPGVVSVAGLDLGLKLPAGRFRSWADGLDANPNYFSFRDEQGILLSGWLDPASEFPGMKPFWAKERAAMQEKRGIEIKSEMALRVGEWEAILYVVPLGDGLSQKNIRACRVVGGTWADVHVSRTAQGSTFKELEDTVRSLELVPAAGAPPHA